MTNQQQEKFVGRYTIIKQLARSPQGLVFLSKSPVTDAPAVIKLYPSKLAQSQQFMKQFADELAYLKRLDHPNIVPITAYGLTDKFPFVDIPYKLGDNLASRIKQGNNLVHLKDAVAQIFQALIYAHRQGVIHGNLKPSNILFDSQDNAYLSDFMVNSLVKENPDSVFSIYSSPEQIYAQSMDERADVFSFGMLLFTWMTGEEPPHSALSDSEDEYQPLSLRWEIPEISVGMNQVIQRATEYHPSDRYSSMKEFFGAFFEALRIDKLFLKMLSDVKSDVTQFSLHTKLDDFSGGRSFDVELDEASGKIRTKSRKKWYDVALGFVGVAIVSFILRILLPYLINLNPSPPYQPAYNPPGFVVVDGRSVEISAPQEWADLLSSQEGEALYNVFGSVDVDLGVLGDFFETAATLPQIMLRNPYGEGFVKITVVIYQDGSLEKMKTTLANELDDAHYIVKDVQEVLLPAGRAILARSIYNVSPSYPSEAYTYVFLYNNKMYLVNFIGDNVSTFEAMMETFRIKS